ncbi:unnamed protein product [Rodentolepis nana]|uniref:Uncharacterized protein n=1 Tax=Rodentolepis nana TaxID=102285 RepID=A0A0R3TGF9_RODNA|nr:unnamed protein product [Rodentolepis nana]
MPGFASPHLTPSHAVSLPQLTNRSEDQTDSLGSNRRQASLLKVNLDKQHSKDVAHVTLTSELLLRL